MRRRPFLSALPYGVVIVIAGAALVWPAVLSRVLRQVSDGFLRNFDWFTLTLTATALVFCALAALHPKLAHRRLGGPAAVPEFRLVTWFAMLFAAGMGAGLVFWGAAEPLIFTKAPPPGGAVANTERATVEALALTQFHWSLHAWGVYAAAAIAVSVSLRPGEPPVPSAPFRRPGLRIFVDWLAVIAVLFGLVASVGQGVIQMGAGVERLSGGVVGDGTMTRLAVLMAVSAAYLLSVARGLRGGIALLSNINLAVAVALALFVLIVGPSRDILNTLIDGLTAYLEALPRLSLDLRPEGQARQWTRDWSITYFLWWIAWTPFVGVFIARVSYGRSLRAFALAVVLVPAIVTLLWFSIFGGTALALDHAGIDLRTTDFRSAPFATYRVLENLPLASITTVLTFVLVFIFILTSADSASLVLAMFAKRDPNPPLKERLFWGLMIAVLTAGAVLSEAGQSVTRAFAVAGAVPLSFLLLAQMLVAAWNRFGTPPATEKKGGNKTPVGR
ncbi:choline/carnitine/betaine transporter family protein [Parvularcula bermudensis HTCC2503]|uniref:Choline/carnitine/betaine transporter family protein n=1 Tax=Parvularcula bermudensis (strain ATCC BAA-594 / HTCC2503 / KCTC 12087) TaxID=314260 RepID=E0TC76_PARBH|nr:BCCT family transporter [Parvularcula bermudensis]ADM08509.1 choline/carnitine/betaine transporter family protein [Parvularcula bermudensis HTCC2503]